MGEVSDTYGYIAVNQHRLTTCQRRPSLRGVGQDGDAEPMKCGGRRLESQQAQTHYTLTPILGMAVICVNY